jgi:hypothetical protein
MKMRRNIYRLKASGNKQHFEDERWDFFVYDVESYGFDVWEDEFRMF